MLELTFGRPGNDQQIAAIQKLASEGLIFSADEVSLALGASKEEAEVNAALGASLLIDW